MIKIVSSFALILAALGLSSYNASSPKDSPFTNSFTSTLSIKGDFSGDF